MAGHSSAIQLLENKDDLVAEDWQFWVGGRSALVVQATSYPTTLGLQLLGRDGQAIAASANITADGITSLDLPPGQYRMNLATGTATDVYATLVRIIY